MKQVFKKSLAMTIALVMLLSALPFVGLDRTESKASAASVRDKVVQHMRDMATIKWKPKTTVAYWHNYGDGRAWRAGNTYYGLPYTQCARTTSLSKFKSYLNSSGVYTGPATSSTLAGSDCSSSVSMAWQQADSSFAISWTIGMMPSKNSKVAKVGSWTDKGTPSASCSATGATKMYAAYDKLQPGDAVDADPHIRLVVSVDKANKRVKCIEQSGLSGNTSWQVDKYYTYSQLFSKGYVPIQLKKLDSGVSYKVKHYQQKVSGSGYTKKDTESFSADKGDTVTPATKSYTGFTAPDKQSVKVKADGSTVIKYYYTRKQYAITVKAGSGISAVSGGGTYYYGASVTIKATASSGYKFSSWSPSNTDKYKSSSSASYKFTMSNGKCTFTATAKKNSSSQTPTQPPTQPPAGSITPGGYVWQSVDTNGFTLDAGYNGVDKKANIEWVKYAVWTDYNGQDDLVWHTVTHYKTWARGTVSVADHNNEGGWYNVHVYIKMKNQSKLCIHGLRVYIDRFGPTIGNVYITRSITGYTVEVEAVDDYSGIVKVQLPTWTDNNGQDDLVWHEAVYTTSRNGYNVYSCTINYSQHNNEVGSYTTHIYVTDAWGNQSTVVGFPFIPDVTPPSINGITATQVGRQVNIAANVTDNLAVHQVFARLAGNGTYYEIALAWDGTNYVGSVPLDSFGTDAGTFLVGITAYDTTLNQTSSVINTSVDVTPPTISDIGYTYTSGGVIVHAKAADSSGVASVSMPTWTENNGQDDLIWHPAAYDASSNMWSVFIPYSDHNNESGTYITHIYASDAYGNTSSTSLGSYNVEMNAPAISNVKCSLTDTGYKVTCKVTDDTAVDRVQFPTWTDLNGQDDLSDNWVESTAVRGIKSGDTYTFYVELGDHNKESGKYITHIYAYDTRGNVSCDTSVTVNVPSTAKYTVKHWKQNVSGIGNTLADTETLSGKVLSSVSPAVKNYSGFTAPTKQSVTVNVDGTTVVNYYYTRNKYALTMNKGEGVSSVSGANSYYFGADVKVSAQVEKGYTFGKWSSSSSSVPGSTNADYTFKMPAENLTLTANATANYYNITYMLDGVVYKTESCQYKNKIKTISDPVKTGFTFSGWKNVPETMPCNDIVVSGEFTRNTYTVKYVADGEEYASQTYLYDAAISLPDNPEKDGYVFSGWQNVPKKMPAGDITIYGSFDPNVYTISYVIDGQLYKNVTLKYGDTIKLIDPPAKEGYTFDGWDTKDVPGSMPSYSFTIFGSYSELNYTITYHLDDEVYFSSQYAYGDTITPPADPEKEGYSFLGWSDTFVKMPSHNVDVYGKMKKNSYKITYYIDGEIYAEDTYQYGQKITAITPVERDGFTFTGWKNVPTTMPAKNIEISGDYEAKTYKLTYMLDDEQVYMTEEYTFGANIQSVANPTLDGYVFKGWSGLFDKMPSHDAVVYAIFENAPYTITYMIDGEIYQTQACAYGQKINFIDEPVKEGYSFSKWQCEYETMPAQNITVNGSFTLNKYTITYVVDNNEYEVQEYNYNQAVTMLQVEEKTGYSFSGWSMTITRMPAEDLIIYGDYSPIDYKLSYYVNDELYLEETYGYGEEITLLADLSVPGYTFSGWSEVPKTMPTKNISTKATLSANEYNLIYYVDGEIYYTEKYKTGEMIDLIEEPSALKENYSFSGWSAAPDTMGNEDISVSGTFEADRYNATYLVNGEEYAVYSLAVGEEIAFVAEPQEDDAKFSGWSCDYETMPAHDIEIIGTLTQNSHSIKYYVDGELYQTVTYDNGADVNAIAEPTKTGYTFSGWSEIPSVMPEHDVEVYGTFTANTYNIKYYVDGSLYKTVPFKYGEKTTVLTEPTKDGYVFSGWSEIPSTMPANDVTVNGTFTKGAHSLKYYVDGVLYYAQALDFGADIVLIDAPKKEGYTFSGWGEVPETMPDEDLIIRGTFTVNEYSIKYYVDGEIYKTVKYEYGAEITPLEEPALDGYNFSGWSFIPSTMPADDIIVNGTFTIGKYKINYYVNGELYKSESYNYGDEVTPLDDIKTDGYVFSGWSEIPQYMPKEDVTVNGTLTPLKFNIYYYVDGELYDTETFDCGAMLVPIMEPKKEGYNFSGWTGLPDVMPAHDVEVNGTFELASYNVNYYVDGELYDTQTYKYGESITALTAPEKEGYTFSGWSEIPQTMPANDVDVSGTFAVNSYKIEYYVDGKLYDTKSAEYGSALSFIDAPEKEGYTFSGWSCEYTSMPANDIKVNGTFAINSYKITYIVDGKEYKTETYKYGDTITPLAFPSKDGYTFSGWSEIPQTMPANDITVNGTFTKNPDPQPTKKYNTLLVAVSNGTGLKVKIGDGAEKNQSMFYKNTKVEFGIEVTLTASSTNGKFMYWIDENGSILSYNETYTFIMTGNKEFTAVYSYTIDDYRTVSFIGAYNQILSTTLYNAESEIIIPEATQKTGFDFVGWSIDGVNVIADENLEKEILAQIVAGNNVEVKAMFKAKDATYVITVENGTGSGTYTTATVVTLTADNAPAGKKFAYWTRDGKIVSYNTSYSFIVNQDSTFKAVFVDENEEVKATAITSIEQITYDSSTNKMSFVAVSGVPEGMNIIYSGVIITNTESVGSDSDRFVKENSNVVGAGKALDGDNCTNTRYTLTKKNVFEGNVWYARSYVMYYDENGTLCTLYGDIVCATVTDSKLVYSYI